MGTNELGRKDAALRSRMQRFAALRSASRALPAAAREMPDAEHREQRASALRGRLAELAALEAPAETLRSALDSALGVFDSDLQEMEDDLLDRFDALDFVSLRASIPRSLESHRREVAALLDVLLAERRGLEARLGKVEYLITMLSTEEVEGRRNIVHDPVTISPALADFPAGLLDAREADVFAMELYQAATLESGSEPFARILRSIRARKQKMGLGCLSPDVLRAVVTYNARMFNSVESLNEASRISDAVVDEVLLGLDDPELPSRSQAIDETLDVVDASEEESGAKAVSETESVFQSEALGCLVEAFRDRLAGTPIGRRGPAERVAIFLDVNGLIPLEVAAIRAGSPSAEQRLICLTTLVGLMLRDPGPIRAELVDLGIDPARLADAWVRELDQAFGRLLSEKLTDAKAYELTSKLAGIKSRHLFKPLNALKAAGRSPIVREESTTDPREVMAAVPSSSTPSAESRQDVDALRARSPSSTASPGSASGGQRGWAIATLALLSIVVGVFLFNVIGTAPTRIQPLEGSSLEETSPYLISAHRDEKPSGNLLVGRVDYAFQSLPLEEKIVAARAMVKSFEDQGVREAMIYDERGMMQVHYSAGQLHRPRPDGLEEGLER